MSEQYLLIAGDLSITSSNAQYFSSGKVADLMDKPLYELFENAAFVAINHEMALTDSNRKAEKRGGFLKASPACAVGIAALGVDLCMLANNHVIDYGDDGVSQTIQNLKQQGISVIGAAESKASLHNLHIVGIDGIKVGLYNVADREFNAATEKASGVNAYDPLETFDQIRDAKRQCDYLLVVFHGGVECYRYPTPNLQKICRKMADAGADAVLCQHSHCIGSYENYNGSYILYGQGNFLFDDGDNEFYKSGLVLQVYPQDRQVVPHLVLKENNGVKLADDAERKIHLEQFEKRSEEILEDGRVEALFKAYVLKIRSVYLNALVGNFPIFRGLNKLTRGGFYKYLYRGMNRLRLINMMNAEALRECMNASVDFSQE